MTDMNHAEVIREALEHFKKNAFDGYGYEMPGSAGKALTALDALARELEDAKAEAERLKESMQRHFIEEHLAGDGPEIDRWKRQCAALDQRHEEDAAEVKRLNHALTDCDAEVMEQSARIARLEEAVNGMLAMYASGPNDDDWSHPAVKFARAQLAPKVER